MPFIIIFLILLIFGVAYISMIMPRATEQPELDKILSDYAHRGLHGDGIPENSLPAFARASERGYGIELDVQLSADGEVMVFHDYTLGRMTGCEKKLCELTAEELKKLFSQ